MRSSRRPSVTRTKKWRRKSEPGKIPNGRRKNHSLPVEGFIESGPEELLEKVGEEQRRS
jgi:hypothetical protein